MTPACGSGRTNPRLAPVGVEKFEVAVEMVGHQEAADGRSVGVGFVLGAVGCHVAEPEAGRRRVARWQSEQFGAARSLKRLGLDELGELMKAVSLEPARSRNWP